ncbi:MAG: 2-C-methyl-D-erythritol 2,4-cyclodiphosphate synthase [Candidatus Cloacimonetes bacterium]|jgi:2-C-methyl-D-erythritol 2,4-cyclodiphosphate synthase|nr:2-C-methyl-D-erythritol 2,4-cyclodiphosphate synthase [Candidatus Cloacimonadota bacterium]
MRIGYGYDVHKLLENRKLILGGVNIPFEKGLLGHSDADVLIHAVIDAILGALAKGDIGMLFPDTDENYKDIDSRILLKKTYEIMQDSGYAIGNLDATICAQQPKLQSYIHQMRENLASDLQTDISNISIKATTEEGIGFIGEGKGISTASAVLIIKI